MYFYPSLNDLSSMQLMHKQRILNENQEKRSNIKNNNKIMFQIKRSKSTLKIIAIKVYMRTERFINNSYLLKSILNSFPRIVK